MRADDTIYVEWLAVYVGCSVCGDERKFPKGEDDWSDLEAWLAAHQKPFQRGADVLADGKVAFMTADYLDELSAPGAVEGGDGG